MFSYETQALARTTIEDRVRDAHQQRLAREAPTTPPAPTAPAAEQLHEALRQVLLRMARLEEELAACEAEHVHYWEPMPVTVGVHRRCAAALREAADELLPPCPSPDRP